MKNNITDILSSLPHAPGVYKFYNLSWEIIYIGKSKNLKSRVNSYFSWQQKLNFAKKKMVWKISNIEYIVTNNETESLILENDLVKRLQPKYNILLKDDKNFLYLKITKEQFPQIRKTRISPTNMKKYDGKYFGPYISGYHVEEILKLLKKIYGYGVGSHNFFKKKWAYSLDSYIFDGNIQADETEIREIYLKKISQIQKFLSGNTQDIKESLRSEMLVFAEKMEFEEAQKRKVSLEALESLDTLQVVRDGVSWDYIVVQILEKYENIYIGVIDIKDSRITAYENYEVENKLSEQWKDVLKKFIEWKWLENRERKKLIFLAPESFNELSDIWISIEKPQLWAKFDLLKLCYKNLYEYAHKKYMASLSTKGFTKKNMQDLLDLLGYWAINKDIIFECNDISHLSWSHTVASRSVIENWKPNSKKYKKFRIKTLQEGKIDDFDSMREIMQRRLKELEKIWNFPDLIVIDGWKWQLSSVMEIIEASEFLQKSDQKLQIVSLAKQEEELFLPWASEPIVLDKESPQLRLIQALRDEAHRFAISFNRDSRSKSMKQSILEAIPGIWPATRKKILKTFGSVEWLQKAEKKELQRVLWKSVIENLENHGIT